HPHQSNSQPPQPHSQQAADRSQTPHRAQSPQPATRSRDNAAPPQSPQAQCENPAPRPDGPRDPQTAKLHQTPTAPSPRCGTSGRPQRQTGPQQSAPPSARRDPHSRDRLPRQRCKAPQQPQQEQAPSNHPTHTRGNSTADGQSEQSLANSPLDHTDMRSTRRYTPLVHTHLSAELPGRSRDAGSRGPMDMPHQQE